MSFTPQCLTRAAMKDSVALQFPHPGRAVTEIAGQHPLVMLAQKRGIQGKGFFEIRKSKRETRQIKLTQNPIAPYAQFHARAGADGSSHLARRRWARRAPVGDRANQNAVVVDLPNKGKGRILPSTVSFGIGGWRSPRN